MPTNILLEPENPSEAVSQYLEVTPLHGDATTPLREVIKTPLISEMDKPHIRIIDFGVGKLEDGQKEFPFSLFYAQA